uniref:S1 motif domain-containing protein n=1 Tax=Chlamydomonas euryale TaxID=1486919 RepID=A0A7R9VUN4_9CHLO
MQASGLMNRVRAAAPAAPRAPVRAAAPLAARNMRLRIAAVDNQETSQLEEGGAAAGAPERKVVAEVDPALAQELEVEELDAAQEQLLSWMMKDDDEQNADLDEMVDYDEFGDEEYADLYEEVEELFEAADVELKVSDKVMGTVYEVDEDGAYVEIGQKYSGFVPLSECSFARLKTPLEVLRVGMSREFLVIEDEDDYGQVILSLAANEASVFWARLRQLQDENMTVTVKVDSANRGGLLVKYGPYDGFVPVSQFGMQINPDTMETMVGSELPVKFLEVDEDKERLVFSNKRVAGTSSADLQGYRIGDVVEGTVQSLRPYGAFLDLGNGTVGLLHVSQISHDRIISVDKILREGDRLKVMVLSMDQQRGRVTLSTKKLEPTPGDMLRDPQLVYEKAEEMAEAFRKRVDAAEVNARAQTEMGIVGDAAASNF